jgi:hypothetical protein
MRNFGLFTLVVVCWGITCEKTVWAQAVRAMPGGLQSLPLLTDAVTRSISAERAHMFGLDYLRPEKIAAQE